MSNAEKIDIGAGEVFGSTLEAFETDHKVVVHQGGTGSGKTYD